jgi:molecular chaperone DnaJ
MFGHEGVRGAGARTFSSYDDIFAAFGDIFGTGLGSLFGDFFGGGPSMQARRARGASLRCEVSVTFEEAARGIEKTILLKRPERCGNCEGTGAKPGTSPRDCPACGGRGEVTRSRGFFTIRSTCPQCGGGGQVVDDPCPDCKGAGRTVQEREIVVRIPPGIEDGTRLRIPGEGEPGERGGPHGDLYCFIDIERHPLFERRGDDVLLEVPISFSQATLGTHVDVPTLHGPRSMRVPPGTQSGAVLRLRGEGFPNVHGYGQGDLLVRVLVEVVKKMPREQHKLIKKLAELESAHVGPMRVEYTRKLAEYYREKKPRQ